MHKSKMKHTRNHNNPICKEDMEFALGERELELSGPLGMKTEDMVELLQLIPEENLLRLVQFRQRHKNFPLSEAINVRLMFSDRYSKYMI